MNTILKEKGIPVNVGRIEVSVLGKINLSKLEMIISKKDTIIYFDNANISIRILPLFSNCVWVENIYLNKAYADLKTDSNGVLNLMSYFPVSENNTQPSSSSKSIWEIKVEEAHLQNVNFKYTDITDEISYAQIINEIDVSFSHFSTLEKRIDVEQLTIRSSKGSYTFNSSITDTVPSDTIPTLWKFSAKNLELDHTDFYLKDMFSDDKTEVKLARASVNLKTLDLAKRNIIVKELILVHPELVYSTYSAKEPTLQVQKNDSLVNSIPHWSIVCIKLNIAQGTFNLNTDEQSAYYRFSEWLPLKNFNTSLDNVEYSSTVMNCNLAELSFSLNDLLFMQSARMKVDMDSLYQGKFLLDMIAFTANDMRTSFTRGDTLNLSAALSGSIDFLKIDKLSIASLNGAQINVEGTVDDIMHFQDAECKLQFSTNAISKNQIQKIITMFSPDVKLPEFETFALSGNIHESFLSPLVSIQLVSNSGSANLHGTYNFSNEYARVNGNFNNLQLKKLFGHNLPEEVSANLIWNGKIGELNDLTGEGELNILKLNYREVVVESLNLNFNVANSSCKLAIYSNDSNLFCAINSELGWKNSSYFGTLLGNFNVNETHTNLLPGNFGLQSELTASFLYSPETINSSLKLKNVVLSDQLSNSHLDSLALDLDMTHHSIDSRLRSDFIAVDFNCESSFKDLSAAVNQIGIREIFNINAPEFINTSNIAKLPPFELTMNAHYDSIFHMFITDTTFSFDSADLKIVKSINDDNIELQFSTNNINYTNTAVYGANIKAEANTSGVSANLAIDSVNVNGESSGIIQFKTDILNDKIAGSLLVADSSGHPLYKLGAEALKSNERIVLNTIGDEWIINSNSWKIAESEFLVWDSQTNNFVADLHLSHDSMQIALIGQISDTIKLHLQEVVISEIISNSVFTSLPDGVLNADISYSDNKRKYLDVNLSVDSFEWNNVFIDHLKANGYYSSDSSGTVESDFIAHLSDSSDLNFRIVNNGSLVSNDAHISFNNVPVNLIEPFTKQYINDLNGYVTGNLDFTRVNSFGVINGDMKLKAVELNIVPLSAYFSIPEDKIQITNNMVLFENFTVFDSLQKQLNVNGSLNIADTKEITSDLKVSLNDIRVMNTSPKDNPDFFGAVIVNSGLHITGIITNPSVKGNITLQEGTNVTYRRIEDVGVQQTQKFVTFASLHTDSSTINLPLTSFRERTGIPVIQTTLAITPKSIFNFEISSSYRIHIAISGSGLLNYAMLPNNTMSLTGSYEIKNGTAELKFTGWPMKYFTIASGSVLRWDGDVEDPVIDLEATSKVKGSYINPVDNKTRYVDFIVSMKLANQLSKLKLVFEVKSSDQYISSVLNSLPEDELMRQAINLLIFESINLPNIESSSDYLSSQINSFWESQLNSLSKTKLKNVDLSFGVDSYTQTSSGGVQEDKTSLTYELERKFFQDRASVKLSGRFNDGSQGASQSNSMIENFIFEYQLDSLERKFLKLYTKQDYDDILDGEVTKSGIGFIYRKSYPDFKSIWMRKRKAVPLEKPVVIKFN